MPTHYAYPTQRAPILCQSHRTSHHNSDKIPQTPFQGIDTSTTLLPPHLSPVHSTSLLNHLINYNPRWKPQPTPPIPPNPETPLRIQSIGIRPIRLPIHSGRLSTRSPSRRFHRLPMLLHQLPSNNPKNLLHAFSRLSTNFMTAIPTHILAPKATAPFRARTACALQREPIRSQKLLIP